MPLVLVAMGALILPVLPVAVRATVLALFACVGTASPLVTEPSAGSGAALPTVAVPPVTAVRPVPAGFTTAGVLAPVATGARTFPVAVPSFLLLPVPIRPIRAAAPALLPVAVLPPVAVEAVAFPMTILALPPAARSVPGTRRPSAPRLILLSRPPGLAVARRVASTVLGHLFSSMIWTYTKGPPGSQSTTLAGPLERVLGGVLLSHTPSSAVPSALVGLASGFGMGPGVSPPL